MENEYTEKIESLLSEYFEYRKSKEAPDLEKVLSMSDKGEQISGELSKGISQTAVFPHVDEEVKDFRWFPRGCSGKQSFDKKEGVPLDKNSFPIMREDQLDNFDTTAELSDSISKLLEPFAALEVEKMDYTDSPIYSELDKDTVTQMAVSAYTNAVLNISDLGDLEAQSSCYSKEQMLRALIKELIIKEIFFLRRLRRW